jgi:hypothetical protein
VPSKKILKGESGLPANTVKTTVSLPVTVKPTPATPSKQQAKSLAEGLNDQELANVLAKVATVRAWAAAIEAEALSRLVKDEKIPGFKLVQGRANRAWNDEERLKKKLDKMGFIPDEFAPRKILSPAQVEALLKKAKRSSEWGTIAPLVTQPQGKLTIAPETDPRPAITRGSEFAEVEYDES